MSGSATLSAPVVLAFGDSLTAGYGLRRGEAFPARLEALLRLTRPGAVVDNAGVSGDTTASGRARLLRVLANFNRRPDLAILALGANDMLRGLDPARMRDNLSWMVEEFHRRGIPVLLAGMVAPAFFGEIAQRFNAVHPDVARRHGLRLYPSFLDGVAGRAGYTLADRLHPNAKAVELVARAILPHVEAELDRRLRP